MISEANARYFRFDGFAVDAERRLLFRDGVPVPLTSKTFDLLLALLESRGDLITKRDLLARVWPNQIVEEGNLTVHVSALRKALGERRGEHRFMVTVPGHGYRFVAEVREGREGAVEPVLLPTVAHAQQRLPSRALVVAAFVIGAVLVPALVLRARDRRAVARPEMTTKLLTARGDVSSAIMSRDGRSFVYVEYKNGLESLWLGRVGGQPPLELRPPEDVDYDGLTFTPDGDRILYSARGALHEMPILGGAVRVTLDHIGSGFALSPDGKRIAFVRRDQERKTSSLVVADVNGGRPERAVSMLTSPRKFSEYGPAWSPDGGQLVIGATSQTTPSQFALTSVRVSDGTLQPLDTHHWDEIGKVTWLHDGSGIVFHTIGARSDYHIWHFDIASSLLRCVTPDMSRYGRQSISVSDDGESLLAVRGVINSSIWVSPSSDTKGARAVTSRTFGKLDGSSGLAWMPDSRIVYVSFFNNSYSLWTMNADGGDVRPLTTPGLVDRFPQATSDGRFVVFESNRGGGVDIWRVDVDGSHMRRLTTSRDNAEPALTPDGRWVLYTHRGNGTQSVWKISIDGGSAERVAPLGSSWPRVSPDGTRLAYAFLDSSSLSRGTAQLIVRSMADQTLVGQFDIARGGTTNNGIHWSPDGSAVIYRNFSGGLWKQPLSGVATKMTDVPNERIYFFDWAKDGKQFALSYGDEVRDVVLMNGFR